MPTQQIHLIRHTGRHTCEIVTVDGQITLYSYNLPVARCVPASPGRNGTGQRVSGNVSPTTHKHIGRFFRFHGVSLVEEVEAV